MRAFCDFRHLPYLTYFTLKTSVYGWKFIMWCHFNMI